MILPQGGCRQVEPFRRVLAGIGPGTDEDHRAFHSCLL